MKKIVIFSLTGVLAVLITAIFIIPRAETELVSGIYEPPIIAEPAPEIIQIAIETLKPPIIIEIPEVVEEIEEVAELEEIIEPEEFIKVMEIVETPIEPAPPVTEPREERKPLSDSDRILKPQKPAPDDNHVFVPGFGWIIPSIGVGEQSYAEGDWNKIIGF